MKAEGIMLVIAIVAVLIVMFLLLRKKEAGGTGQFTGSPSQIIFG